MPISPMHSTYWNHNGRYEKEAKKLNRLIPTFGAVDFPRSANKALEKFRVASNAYYDIYNNGTGNRDSAIRRLFDVSPGEIRHYFRYYSRLPEWIVRHIEEKMDEIVMAADKEQNVIYVF